MFTDATTSSAGISSNTTVNGNLGITVGNGVNTLGTEQANVQNNLNVTIGNGANSANTLTVTGPVGNTVNYRAGNGGDSLTLDNNPANSSTQFYYTNAFFGNGSNNLTFGDTGGGTNLVVISGYFSGGNSGTNVFAQNANASTASPFTLIGF